MANANLEQLAARGQSIWIDLLSRELVRSGELQKMVDELSVTGLTSNPSIFQKAIAGGGDYDDQIRELLNETDDPREIFVALAIEDVRAACDVLHPVWERTDGLDGYVSLEVDPDLAFNTEGTYEQAVEHDDMNVLCLGSEIVGPSVARELVEMFLAAEFDGGERYVARLKKVELLERGM